MLSPPNTPGRAALSPNSQIFLQYCVQLFSPATPQEQRRLADEWLNQFQLTWEAWNVVDEILKTQSVDEPVLFLAAQTLNRKIRYDRTQLGEADEVWFALRSAVIAHLMLHAHRTAVVTQLSLALVALLIQMETWQGAIGDLIAGLRQSNPVVLLDCLKLIPEEVDDQSLDVSNARRYVFKTEMLDSSKVILLLLVEVNAKVPRALLFDCLTSWLIYADIEFKDMMESGLLELCFAPAPQLTQLRDLEAAVQLLIEACYCFRDELPMMHYMVPRITQRFGPIFARSNVAEERNELAKLFSQCAEAFLHHLTTEYQADLISLATQVYVCQDYVLARKVMYFWIDFLTSMYNRVYAQLLPVFEILYQASFTRMLASDENEESDEDEESEDGGEGDGGEDVEMLGELEQHRYETSQIIENLLACAGYEFTTRFVEPKLLEMAQQCNKLTLPQAEALFRVFQASVPRLQTNEVISYLLQVAIQYSQRAPTVRKITCEIIAQLVPYHISKYADIYLEICMQFLLESLVLPTSEAGAARTIRKLCLNQTIAPRLAVILESTLLLHPSIQTIRRAQARLDILEGFTRLYVTLSFLTSDGNAMLFRKLVDPIWQQVSAALQAEDIAALNLSLDCITIVIQASVGSMVEAVPQEIILSKLWLILPCLTQVHERAVEHVGRVIKHAFRTFPAACRPQGKLIIDFIVKRYRYHPVSGLLYIAGAFFQEYFACEELSCLFPEVLALLTQLSFDLVLVRMEAFVQHPNFVEDLYYLANRTLENTPEVLVQYNDSSFNRLVGMASEIGVALEHREAFRSVAVFLESAISILGGNPKLRSHILAALEQHGNALVYNLVNGLCGAQAAERVADQNAGNGTIAHVLLALFELWEGKHFERIMAQCLAQQAHLSLEMRVGFVPSFVKAALEHGMHQVATVCTDFADSARRRKLRVIKDK